MRAATQRQYAVKVHPEAHKVDARYASSKNRGQPVATVWPCHVVTRLCSGAEVVSNFDLAAAPRESHSNDGAVACIKQPNVHM